MQRQKCSIIVRSGCVPMQVSNDPQVKERTASLKAGHVHMVLVHVLHWLSTGVLRVQRTSTG